MLLFGLIRLVGITNPPLEIGHNWRQVTGLMVARNFLEVDANILYPRVDETNGGSGIIGMEFPALNYLHFLTAKIFGYTHWYGRLINLLISSLGLFFFGKIVHRFFDNRTAIAATIILASSIWFSFSRKMMPDTASVSLVLVGVYCGLRYLDSSRFSHLLWLLALAALGALVKLPAAMFLVPFILGVVFSKFKRHKKLLLYAATAIAGIAVYLWYFYWYPHLESLDGKALPLGADLLRGFHELVSNPGKTGYQFYFSALRSYIGLALLMAALVLCFLRREKTIIFLLITLFPPFLLYMLKAGFNFHHHTYYIIPLVPLMAILAGWFLAQLKHRWIYVVLLAAIGIEGIANQQHDFFVKDSERYKLELENFVDQFSNSDDLMVFSGSGNPQQLYLAHRKGWVGYCHQFDDSASLSGFIDHGAKFLVINTLECELNTNLRLIATRGPYRAYRLAD